MIILDALTAKQVRSCRHDLATLFRLKSYVFPQTIEEYRALGIFAPKLKVAGRDIYLGERANQALRRIVEALKSISSVSDIATYNDVWQLARENVESWFERECCPELEEYLEGVEARLLDFQRTRMHVYRVSGVQLKDVASVNLGEDTLRIFTEDLLNGVENSNVALARVIEDKFFGKVVICGRTCGSRDKAKDKFVRRAQMAISVLRLYACLLYEQAVTDVQVHLLDQMMGAQSSSAALSWDDTDKALWFSRYKTPDQELPLSSESIDYLRAECFLTEACVLLGKNQLSELEAAIVRAIYWFGEAHKDRDSTMKFVKLWTCAEAFFSVDDEQLTERNATGIATVLTFGGYGVNPIDKYRELKRHVKRYYKMRSKALHRGHHGHVSRKDLVDFCQLIAWLIVTMISFTTRGYEDPTQVLKQCHRLDQLESTRG